MRKLLGMLVGVALGGCFATIGGDGRTGGGEAVFTLSLPEFLPPLIVVQPGISVVRDLDHEVFYADGYYWARQDQAWFRARSHRSGWTWVDDRDVPGLIAQSSPGRYRHYRGDGHPRIDQEQWRRDDDHS